MAHVTGEQNVHRKTLIEDPRISARIIIHDLKWHFYKILVRKERKNQK